MEFDLIAICMIGFLISALVFGVFMLIYALSDYYTTLKWVKPLIISICLWVGIIFLGIGLNTNGHKAYIQSYLIQKQTIETSVDNGNLSGLERVELVNKATELNGELAKRKVYIKYWNAGVFDNTIYDDIEFIDLG